jgi:hypothetical protein
MCSRCIYTAKVNHVIQQLCSIFFILMFAFSIFVFIEWMIGPLFPQLRLLWRHVRARYRVRSKVVALLEARMEREWEQHLDNIEPKGFWTNLPAWVLNERSDRTKFINGLELAVAVMDQDFDAKFATEIQEEFIRLGGFPQQTVVAPRPEKPVRDPLLCPPEAPRAN